MVSQRTQFSDRPLRGRRVRVPAGTFHNCGRRSRASATAFPWRRGAMAPTRRADMRQMSCGLWHALNTLTIRLASSIAAWLSACPFTVAVIWCQAVAGSGSALAGKPWLP
jgi:hypothetical protein